MTGKPDAEESARLGRSGAAPIPTSFDQGGDGLFHPDDFPKISYSHKRKAAWEAAQGNPLIQACASSDLGQCLDCHLKRVECSGGHPCTACLAKQDGVNAKQNCAYPPQPLPWNGPRTPFLNPTDNPYYFQEPQWLSKIRVSPAFPVIAPDRSADLSADPDPGRESTGTSSGGMTMYLPAPRDRSDLAGTNRTNAKESRTGKGVKRALMESGDKEGPPKSRKYNGRAQAATEVTIEIKGADGRTAKYSKIKPVRTTGYQPTEPSDGWVAQKGKPATRTYYNGYGGESSPPTWKLEFYDHRIPAIEARRLAGLRSYTKRWRAGLAVGRATPGPSRALLTPAQEAEDENIGRDVDMDLTNDPDLDEAMD